MRVGLAAASEGELQVLRRALVDARVDIAWVATSGAELANSATDISLVVVAHGALDAFSCAAAIATRGVAVVLVVVDPLANIDALYRVTGGTGIEVAQMPTLAADGTLRDHDALASIVARHRRVVRPSTASARTLDAPVLAIAASAGGPEALAEVLSGLATDLPMRVIVAQHIGPTFAPGLASWLGSRTKRRVEIADDGRALDVEATLVVRSDRQPTLDARGVVRYGPLDPANPFHPCIDVLFASLAAARALHGVAALLTGMGSDGAEGLLALRCAGWTTIAQDAESSRVFGMPRAAARLDAASHVVALDRIGATASRALRREVGARA